VNFLTFVRENARWLVGAFLLTLFSTFGQTVFISLSAGHIRSEYGLSDGGFGTLYMAATLASAMTLPQFGKIVDRYSPMAVTLLIVPGLALACVLMAASHSIVMLVVTIYMLRLFGQGMMTHNAMTATARWFVAQRGKAVSVVTQGVKAGWSPACYCLSWRCRLSSRSSVSTGRRALPIRSPVSSLDATGRVTRWCAIRCSIFS
jgi:MFS family permease